MLPEFPTPRDGTPFIYHWADGTPAFAVVRTEAKNGRDKKAFRQWSIKDGEWEPKQHIPQGQRPLFGLPEFEAIEGAKILVVEGEKKRARAAELFPAYFVTCWAGGANAVHQTDWTPLLKHHVTIWPDNDGPGIQAAQAIKTVLPHAHIVDVPLSFPEAWDLGDEPPEGVTVEDLHSLICKKPLQQEPTFHHQNDITIPEYVLIGPEHEPRGEKMNGHGIDLPIDYIRTEKGGIKPLFANAVFMLRRYSGKWNLRFDEFSQRAVSDGEPLNDSRLREISEWMQYEGLHATPGTIAEAVVRAAELNKFHPVREYLDSLVWDNIPRIDHILIDYAGAHDDDHGLNRAFTAKWLIQAVARIYEPGCHARATLVLEGVQDIGKSTIFREIFGDRWFTDHLPDISNKDALLQLRGVWCVEIAELATLGRADSARIKQFLTSRVDRYRDPYGRLVADYPRTCVFGGTVNPGARGYLKDETGGTRFWPVTVTKVDIPAFRDYRDQIWAEAVQRYRSGELWYLTGHIVDAARQRQSERYEGDPWEDRIEDFIRGREDITVQEILRDGLGMSTQGDWTQGDMNRVVRCLSELGWERGRKRHGNKVIKIYTPPTKGAEDGQEVLEL